jgi:hypothetical protein
MKQWLKKKMQWGKSKQWKKRRNNKETIPAKHAWQQNLT